MRNVYRGYGEMGYAVGAARTPRAQSGGELARRLTGPGPVRIEALVLQAVS